jgi:hypothetical protein
MTRADSTGSIYKARDISEGRSFVLDETQHECRGKRLRGKPHELIRDTHCTHRHARLFPTGADSHPPHR